MKTHSGSCLCGAVHFEVEGEFETFFLCHCQYCQKDTGSAHAANLFSSSATISWSTGQEWVTNYQLPSTKHSKSFCSICGSALPSVQMDGRLLVVPAGSLNSQVTIKPTAHIFIASKANWDTQLEQITKFDEFPL